MILQYNHALNKGSYFVPLFIVHEGEHLGTSVDNMYRVNPHTHIRLFFCINCVVFVTSSMKLCCCFLFGGSLTEKFHCTYLTS